MEHHVSESQVHPRIYLSNKIFTIDPGVRGGYSFLKAIGGGARVSEKDFC